MPGAVRLGDGTPLPGKRTVVVDPESEVVIETPGGGGMGGPRHRGPELVAADVRDGLVTREQAREAYGVALTEDGEVDAEETVRLRTSV